MSIGLPNRLKINAVTLTQSSWKGTLEDLYCSPMDDIVKISKAAQHFKKTYHLDDYGVFRVIVDVFERIPITIGRTHRTFSQAVHYKNWSRESFLIVLARVLRNNGLRVVPIFGRKSVGLLFDVDDEYDLLNARRLECRWSSGFEIRGVTWDGISRMGMGTVKGEFPSKMDIAEEKKLRPCSFRNRKIPNFVKEKGQRQVIPFYGTSHKIHFQLYPYLTSYLKYFPSFRFGEQIELAWQEVKIMGFRSDLLQIQRQIRDEVEFMDLLCRSIQAYTKYESGPLHSVSTILTNKKGDCDQFSMLLGAILLEIGYDSSDIIGCHWSDLGDGVGHIMLAIRPKRKSPPNGAKLEISGKGTYFCLDPTYYVRKSDGTLQSSWGKISDDYRGKTNMVKVVLRNIV